MKSTISGQSRNLVPVPNRGGTGTTWAKPKWYQYHDKVVPVPLNRKGLVPVPNQVVPIPMLPPAPIFVFLHC